MTLENQLLLKDGTQFTTAENVNVNNRIARDQTFVFNRFNDAEAKARQMRSYVYELFAQEKRDKRPGFYGYAVPK